MQLYTFLKKIYNNVSTIYPQILHNNNNKESTYCLQNTIIVRVK